LITLAVFQQCLVGRDAARKARPPLTPRADSLSLALAMRSLALFLASALLLCADEVQWPRLAGIVHLKGPDKPAAILVSPPPNALPKIRVAPGPSYTALLHVGERDNGLDFGNIEVTSIESAAGVVRLRHAKSAETTELKLSVPLQGEQYLLHLERAPLSIVLECYQQLSARTLIHSPYLVFSEVDLHVPAKQDSEDALAIIRKTLEAQDTLIIPCGDKYAFAVRKRDKAIVNSILAPPAGAAIVRTPPTAIIPPGLIRFISADILQVIEFYGDLSGRTVLRPAYLAPNRVTLRSQTAANREEATWMMEAALRLCGLETALAGDKFVFVVPPEQTARLPKFDLSRQVPGNPVAINLINVDPQKLLETYAALVGRKAAPIDANVLRASFTLRSQAPLSPAEAAFALEAIAQLNDLAFERAGETGVKLVSNLALPPRL